MPKLQFFNNNGLPLAGGFVYTYQPGTMIAKPTYTLSSGLVANPNPVVLDSAGRPPNNIWLSGYYAIYLYDSLMNLIWSVDNVSSMPSYISGAQWIPQPLVYTYIGTTQFSTPGDYTTLFTVGSRISATVTAGTIYGTVTASTYGAPITTVTCMWDAGALDAGLSAVYTGIITTAPNAMPVIRPIEYTVNQVFTVARMNGTYIANLATAISFTLPPANTIPSGGWFKFINKGTGPLTVVGTVSGIASPFLNIYDEITCVSDGTQWYGILVQAGPAELYAYGATAVTALNMGTVYPSERWLVEISVNLSWTGAPVTVCRMDTTGAGTATFLWTNGTTTSSEKMPIDTGIATYVIKSDVLRISAVGTLTITNTITPTGGGLITYTHNDIFAYRLRH
jgi:hypothetical protein